jgi:hypothetical protein
LFFAKSGVPFDLLVSSAIEFLETTVINASGTFSRSPIVYPVSLNFRPNGVSSG